MLTERQADCLAAIQELIDERGHAFGIRVLAQRMGYRRSHGPVHKLVCGLEERGFIRRGTSHFTVLKPNRVAMFVFDEKAKDLRPFKSAAS